MKRSSSIQILFIMVLAILLATGSAAVGQTANTKVVKKATTHKQVKKTPPKKVMPIVPAKVANNVKVVTIQSTRGNIVMELYPALMPVTVANFEKLVKSGFYNGLTFHRVEGWVIQGGDPAGNGTGGPGWAIKLETNPKLKNVRGALAMARAADPNSAGSQFYILKTDAPWLDGQYAVFGRVTKGMDVVDKVQIGDKMIKVTIQ
ncbi:MAG: peptidylprolyl isomerase [Acidobacteriota bacterium]